MLVLQSEAKLASVSDRLHERVSGHITKLCALAPDRPLQRRIYRFPLQSSAFPSPLRAVFDVYQKQLEPVTSLWINELPAWVMPSWQTLKESVTYLEPGEAVHLCRSLRFRGAHLYFAASETDRKRIGVAAAINYRMETGTVKQQAIAWSSTCSLESAELTAIRYALQHARETLRKMVHVYIATTSREALATIEKATKSRPDEKCCTRLLMHSLRGKVSATRRRYSSLLATEASVVSPKQRRLLRQLSKMAAN